MATSKLKATFRYNDYGTRAVTVGDLATNSTAVADFKVNVKAFNATGVDAVSDTFLSDAGAPLVGISEAEIITTDQTVIYAKSELLAQRALTAGTDEEG